MHELSEEDLQRAISRNGWTEIRNQQLVVNQLVDVGLGFLLGVLAICIEIQERGAEDLEVGSVAGYVKDPFKVAVRDYRDQTMVACTAYAVRFDVVVPTAYRKEAGVEAK